MLEQIGVLEGLDKVTEPAEEDNLNKGLTEQPDQDECPDGLQYKDEELGAP